MVAYYTTTHEGHAACRTSARHVEQVYQFAVWGRDTRDGNARIWKCLSYCGRRDLAEASGRQWRNYYNDVAIAPVECKIRLSKRQKDWLAANKAKEGKTHVY